MIDSSLIKAHQWVVDTTQKKPGWWAEQVIIANTILNLAIRVLRWEGGFWDFALTLLTLTMGVLLVRMARNEAMLKGIADAGFVRALLLGCSVGGVAALIIKPTGTHFLDMVSTLAITSFYYFAACENPRPKKRKEKLVLRTA